MKSAKCSAAGSNPRKTDKTNAPIAGALIGKMEVPGRAEADVVVGIAIPVVDIHSVLIEVADAREQPGSHAGRAQIVCSHQESPKIEHYFLASPDTNLGGPLAAGLCALSSEFYSGASAFCKAESPPETNKKFHLRFFIARYRNPWTTILRRSLFKEEAFARRSRGRTCISKRKEIIAKHFLKGKPAPSDCKVRGN